MKPVILESPYAGDIERNVAYARAAMHDCLLRDEAPFASHLLYTQAGVLSDEQPDERTFGILAGFTWRELAYYTVVYVDLGISSGMILGIQHALKIPNHRVECRSLKGWTDQLHQLRELVGTGG